MLYLVILYQKSSTHLLENFTAVLCGVIICVFFRIFSIFLSTESNLRQFHGYKHVT